MRRFHWFLLLAVGLPMAAQSSGIYKCAAAGRNIAYQNFPCAEGQTETLLIAGGGAVGAPVPEAKPAATLPTNVPSVEETRPSLPFRNTTLRIGMSDDEVLNLPRWGRPDKIMRSKTNHAWHEQWVYASLPAGPKRLYFDNARLAAIQDEPPPAQQMAGLSLQ